MTFKILSCDGGGIRGLITALLIQDLDQKYNLIKKADGFAGTSTGGLIALALANGTAIADIVEIYQTKGKEIFECNGWCFGEAEESFTNEANSNLERPGYRASMYTNAGLLKIAKNLFHDAKLSDLSKLAVINTARLWDPKIQSWAPCTFSSDKNNPFSNISLCDAALATSAAPTYFPPYQISGLGYFVDGGLFANNPSVTAIAETLSSRKIQSLDDMRLLSIGTGMSPEGITPKSIGNPLDWGISSWLWPFKSGTVPSVALLKLTMDATSKNSELEAKRLLNDKYQRGNFTLLNPLALDDWKNTADLVKQTQAYLMTDDWKTVCQWVEKCWG